MQDCGGQTTQDLEQLVIPDKLYFKIGEVSTITEVEPHVLRYWETQFDVLRLTKNQAGNRVFRPKDIELILLVKNLLYDQKYTIQGANQKLLDMRKDGKLEGSQQEVLGPEFLASMKVELEQLSKVLTPSEPLEEHGKPEGVEGEAVDEPDEPLKTDAEPLAANAEPLAADAEPEEQAQMELGEASE